MEDHKAMIRYVRIAWFITLFLDVAIFVILLGPFSYIFVIRVFGTNSATPSNNEEVETHNYKIFQVDPLHKTSSVGVVSIFDDLSSDDFLSYVGDDGVHNLISNFETGEYLCTGSCHCSDTTTSDRRFATSSTSKVKTGIIYLVAAFTSIIAYEKAKEHFESECVNELKDNCESPFQSIVSDVENCEKIDHSSSSSEKDEEVEFKGVNYWCEGNCVLRKDWQEELVLKLLDFGDSDEKSSRYEIDRHEYLKKESEFCKNHALEKVVRIDKNYGEPLGMMKAKFFFEENELPDFCVDIAENCEGSNTNWCLTMKGEEIPYFNGQLDAREFRS